MAFRASSQIKTDALTEIKQGAIRAKAFALQVKTAMDTADTNVSVILNLLANAKGLIDRWAILSATPGLAAYAADQENDVAYDVSVEFTAMRNALIAVRDRIINDLPTATQPVGVAGRLAVYTLNAAGDLVPATFTPAQLVNLRNDLNNFIATIT